MSLIGGPQKSQEKNMCTDWDYILTIRICAHVKVFKCFKVVEL